MIDRLTAQALSSIPTWLQMLAQIYPPQNITLVGAGNGTDLLVGWLTDFCKSSANNVSKITLVEPDELSHKQLAKRIVDQHHWRLLADMVVPNKMINTDNEYPYYQYSLTSENGLLESHSLKPIWPGILLKSQQYLTGVSLNQLFPSDWLLLDCLPAAELLNGIEIPEGTQVILTRAIMNQEAAPVGSSFDEINNLLETNGFKAIVAFEERNSALSKILYVRDSGFPKKHVDRLEQEKEQLQKRCDELVAAREKFEKLASERQAMIKQLDQRLQIMQANIANSEARYRSLQSELLKAEAQIDLIKVFVLQDK